MPAGSSAPSPVSKRATRNKSAETPAGPRGSRPSDLTCNVFNSKLSGNEVLLLFFLFLFFVLGFGCRVSGFEFRVSGFGFRMCREFEGFRCGVNKGTPTPVNARFWALLEGESR